MTAWEHPFADPAAWQTQLFAPLVLGPFDPLAGGASQGTPVRPLDTGDSSAARGQLASAASPASGGGSLPSASGESAGRSSGAGAVAPSSGLMDALSAAALGAAASAAAIGPAAPRSPLGPAGPAGISIGGGGASGASGSGGTSSLTSSADPLWVLDAPKAIVVTPGVIHHDFADWEVDLRAQVAGGTVDTYDWDLSEAPDATDVSGETSYRLQFTWDDFTGAARTNTLTLTVTYTDDTELTQTLTFQVAATDSPAWTSDAPTSVSTWPAVLPPDALKPDQASVAAPYGSLGLATGAVLTGHSLPAYNPGVPALQLVYSSLAADPRPIFLTHYELDPGQAVPATVKAQLTLNSTAGQEFYYDTSLLNPGGILEIALQGDATGLATGRYSYQIDVTANYSTPATTQYTGQVNLVNAADSPFGAGWGLANVQRLWPVTGGVILEMAGGTSLWFASAGGGTFTSPAGDFSALVQNTNDTYTRTYKDGTQVHFDSDGLQTAQVDRNGNTIAFGYDTGGRLTSITDFSDLVTAIAYDTAGNVSSITDPADRETLLTASSQGLLTAIADADDAVWGFSYDSAGRLTDLTDPREYTTSFDYNFAGRVETVTRPDETTQELTALQLFGLVENGSGTSSAPAEAVLAVQAQPAYVDPLSNLWLTRLDWLGFGTSSQPVDPLGNQAEIYRDANGLAWLASDPLGRRQRSVFDSLGNPTQVTRNDDASYEFVYNSFSQVTEFTEPPSLSTGYTYDTEGNLTDITTADGTTAFTYTTEGWLESVTDPLEHTVTFDYDSCGRLTSRTDALEHTATFAYDTASNLTSYTDERDFTTTFTYDALGRALTQVLPDDNPSNEPTITLTYDVAGNLTSLTDPVDNETSYTYDELNRRVTAGDPLENTTAYAYDAVGNLTGLADRNGRVRVFTYDAAGRLTNEDWLDEEEESIRTFTYTYDAAGQLTSASDPDSTYSYTYDALGQLTEEDNEGTPDLPQVVLTYTYDVAGNRTELSDNLGASIAYEYDDLHRLTRATLTDAEDNGPDVTFTYDGAGRLTDVSRATHEGLGTTTGVSTSLTYDDADRLTDITHTNPLTIPPETIASYRYGYDDAGLATGYTGPEGTLSYTYNARGELTAMSGDRTESYSYDFNGNRTMTGYTTGTGNQLTSDAAYDYTYDDEGNLLTKTRISDDRLTEFTWDYRNLLTKVLVKNSSGTVLQETRFTYDVYNRRIGKWLDADGSGSQAGVQQWTVFDGVNTYADFTGSGALTYRYFYSQAADSLLARLDESGDAVWYPGDLLGSVRQVVNPGGTVIDQITYDSYGKVLTETSPGDGDRFKYVSREYDPEISAYHYRARMYDPQLGRFISSDPLGFRAGDPNLYRYVGNRPTGMTDPSGMAWSWAAAGAGAALGAIGGFFYGIGHQTVSVIQGNQWNWGYVGSATVIGAAGGAATGALVGACTGDPSSLLVGGSLALTGGGAAVGGFVAGGTDAAINQPWGGATGGSGSKPPPWSPAEPYYVPSYPSNPDWGAVQEVPPIRTTPHLPSYSEPLGYKGDLELD